MENRTGANRSRANRSRANRTRANRSRANRTKANRRKKNTKAKRRKYGGASGGPTKAKRRKYGRRLTGGGGGDVYLETTYGPNWEKITLGAEGNKLLEELRARKILSSESFADKKMWRDYILACHVQVFEYTSPEYKNHVQPKFVGNGKIFGNTPVNRIFKDKWYLVEWSGAGCKYSVLKRYREFELLRDLLTSEAGEAGLGTKWVNMMQHDNLSERKGSGHDERRLHINRWLRKCEITLLSMKGDMEEAEARQKRKFSTEFEAQTDEGETTEAAWQAASGRSNTESAAQSITMQEAAEFGEKREHFMNMQRLFAAFLIFDDQVKEEHKDATLRFEWLGKASEIGTYARLSTKSDYLKSRPERIASAMWQELILLEESGRSREEKHVEAAQAEAEGDLQQVELREEEKAEAAQLRGLQPSELRKRASVHLTEAEMARAADEGGDEKGTLIDLIIRAQRSDEEKERTPKEGEAVRAAGSVQGAASGEEAERSRRRREQEDDDALREEAEARRRREQAESLSAESLQKGEDAMITRNYSIAWQSFKKAAEEIRLHNHTLHTEYIEKMRAAQVEDVRNQLRLQGKPMVKVNTEWTPSQEQKQEDVDYLRSIKPDQVFRVLEVSENAATGAHTGWYRGKLSHSLTPNNLVDGGKRRGWFPSWAAEPLIAEESSDEED